MAGHAEAAMHLSTSHPCSETGTTGPTLPKEEPRGGWHSKGWRRGSSSLALRLGKGKKAFPVKHTNIWAVFSHILLFSLIDV